MPVVLALVAVLVLLVAPPAVAAHDLEPTGATPDVVVEIGSSVAPREVRVPAGSVVGWVNRDGDRHRVRSRSGPAEFDSGNLETGERFAVRLATPGTYAYVDDRDRDASAYHGRIVVTAAGEAGTGGGASTGGGDSTGGDGATGVEAPATSVTAAIGDRVFTPSSVEVAVGGTVTWANDDDREHTVTGVDGTFGSEVMGSGATFRQRFATAGTFAFLCAIHPEMRGQVEVIRSAAAPVTPAPTATPGPTATATPAPTPTATPTSTPTAAPSVRPAPSSSASPSPSTEAALSAAGVDDGGTTGDAGTGTGAGDTSTAAAASSAHALEGLVGLIVGVVLVSVAAALFAKTIGGTVRRPG